MFSSGKEEGIFPSLMKATISSITQRLSFLRVLGERHDHLNPEARRELVRGQPGWSHGLLPRVLRAGRSAITLKRRRASRSQRPSIRSPASTTGLFYSSASLNTRKTTPIDDSIYLIITCVTALRSVPTMRYPSKNTPILRIASITHVNVYIYNVIVSFIDVRTFARADTHECIPRKYVHKYIHIYIDVYYTCMCMCVYIYTYVHTYTQTRGHVYHRIYKIHTYRQKKNDNGNYIS